MLLTTWGGFNASHIDVNGNGSTLDLDGHHQWEAPPAGDATSRCYDEVILVSLVMTVSTVCNLLMLYALYRTPHLRTVQNIFTVNLGLTHLSFLAVTLLSVSVATIACISLDRHLSICHALQYPSEITSRRVYLMVGYVWVQGTLTASAPLLGWGRYTFRPVHVPICLPDWSFSRSYTAFMLCVALLVPFVVMVYSYSRIMQAARRQTKHIETIQLQLVHPALYDRLRESPSATSLWSRRVSREDTTTSAQRSLLGRAGSDASRGAPDRRDAGWSQRAPPGNSPTSPRRSELRRGNSGDASPSAAGASDSSENSASDQGRRISQDVSPDEPADQPEHQPADPSVDQPATPHGDREESPARLTSPRLSWTTEESGFRRTPSFMRRLLSGDPTALGSRHAAAAASSARRVKTIRTVFLVVGAFFICWCPYVCVQTWFVLGGGRRAVPYALDYGSTALVFTTCAVDPVVFMSLNREFRRALRLMLARGFTVLGYTKVAQRLRLGDRTTSALETLRLQHSRGAVSGDSGVELDPALNNHNHNHSPQNHAAAEPAANHLAVPGSQPTFRGLSAAGDAPAPDASPCRTRTQDPCASSRVSFFIGGSEDEPTSGSRRICRGSVKTNIPAIVLRGSSLDTV